MLLFKIIVVNIEKSNIIDSLERPVFNDSEAINLTFGLTLQQIIDVVSRQTPPIIILLQISFISILIINDSEPHPHDPHPCPRLLQLSIPNSNRIGQPVKLAKRTSCTLIQTFPAVFLFDGNYCCRYFSDPISQYFTRVDNMEWNKRQAGGPAFRPG